VSSLHVLDRNSSSVIPASFWQGSLLKTIYVNTKMKEKYSYYVYILTNKLNTVFYTGFTNNIIRRLVEHKMKIADGFTKKYNVNKLVYYEYYTDVYSAINREKKIKIWKKEWKLRIIKKENPEMKDLIYDFMSDNEIEEMKSVIMEREKNKNEIPA
jgi:putative endonuclease